MLRAILVTIIFLVPICAFAQTSTSNPCEPSQFKAIISGVDPDQQRCVDLVMMEKLIAAESAIIQLEAQRRLLTAEKARADQKEKEWRDYFSAYIGGNK